jgi:hypothetical protein
MVLATIFKTSWLKGLGTVFGVVRFFFEIVRMRTRLYIVRPQFEFKLPPPKQMQEELFESLIVYCWYVV